MKIPCVRLIVPVLVGTVFASCTSSKQSAFEQMNSVVRQAQYISIDGYVYGNRGVIDNRLSCLRLYSAELAPNGTSIPLSQYCEEARRIGIEQCLALTLRDGAALTQDGDTVFVPLQDIAAATDNSTYSLDLDAQDYALIVLVGLLVAALGAVIYGFATSDFWFPD